MLNNFIKFILTQRLMVIMAAAALSVAGVIAWRMLPIDAFPDVTNVQVMVLSDAPGLASVDVEQRVTFPVEKSLQGLPKVRQVRSMSKAGFSQVIAVFEDDVDTYFARQLVFERLQAAKESVKSSRARRLSGGRRGLRDRLRGLSGLLIFAKQFGHLGLGLLD